MVRGLNVAFDSPGNGVLEFGWTGPLTLDDVEIALSGYKRFDNPYTRVEVNTLVYEIAYDGVGLLLDFEKGVREAR